MPWSDDLRNEALRLPKVGGVQSGTQETTAPSDLKKWKAATQEVCTAAYDPYRLGTIYPQMVVGCDDRLNRVQSKELKGLGE